MTSTAAPKVNARGCGERGNVIVVQDGDRVGLGIQKPGDETTSIILEPHEAEDIANTLRRSADEITAISDAALQVFDIVGAVLGEGFSGREVADKLGINLETATVADAEIMAAHYAAGMGGGLGVVQRA